MHTGQPSGPGGLSSHSCPGSLSFPLCIFAHTLSAGSEFTLFKSLKQAPPSNMPGLTHHTLRLIFAYP